MSSVANRISPIVDLYLDLLKKALTDSLHERQCYLPVPRPERPIKRAVYDFLAARGLTLVRQADPAIRGEGTERLPSGTAWLDLTAADTLLGRDRLNNLQRCVEAARRRQVPGDLIETGVWRGGACILMRAILKAYGVYDRKVWAADSFEGLPVADTTKYPLDHNSKFHQQRGFAVSLDQVQGNFEKYGLLDDQVKFVKGWFCDTLPKLVGHAWAVIRLDGDMYQSTMEALVNLYPGLSPGGYVIIDDFGACAPCRQAVLDFRNREKIGEEMRVIDWTAVYWQRQSTEPATIAA